MSSTGDSGAGSLLRVICGPTAAGKSAIVEQLARIVPLGVISADSRQLYRGFDIGTAKPLPDERRLTPHFGLDVAEPTERYSAARWADAVPGWLQAIAAMRREPVVVGGTGFYLRALFAPLFRSPELHQERRERLGAWLATIDTAELRRWCATLDPARASLGRTQLLRAIETALLTGRRISELQRSGARAPSLHARYLVLDPGRGLVPQIEARTDAMLAAGWLEEVRRLTVCVPGDAPAWSATGYDALRRVALGEWGEDRARDAVVVATRQYARRQRTWFRHQLREADITRLDPRAPDALDRVLAWWRGED